MLLKDKELRLVSILNKIPQEPYPFQSRIHALNGFNSKSCKCYVKRDDELGFGITGSKFRKFRSLISHILAEECDEVIAVGGVNSNSILGLAQLFTENNISATYFLRGDPSEERKGNALFSSAIIQPSKIQWVSRKDWINLNSIIASYKEPLEESGKKVFVVPEGASHKESLPGALSLSLDISRNEQTINKNFNHIFIEAGTGLTAIALILGYAWLEKKSLIHVLLLADKEAEFRHKLLMFHHYFEELVQDSIPIPNNYICYRSRNARSFGAVNKAVLKEIHQLGKEEGFLTDPVYSAKLFLEGRSLLHQTDLQGTVLFVHSGGGTALAGFSKQLKKVLNVFSVT